jgi:hypothetical protein|tara:strand:+ start:250 stop:510 length:261 start_codon:yes stop_codon:yes gene_type:complete
MRKFNYNGIEFDDVVGECFGGNVMWSQICGDCQRKHSDKIEGLGISDLGSGICGVKGCDNEDDSVLYIDFPNKISLKEDDDDNKHK